MRYYCLKYLFFYTCLFPACWAGVRVHCGRAPRRRRVDAAERHADRCDEAQARRDQSRVQAADDGAVRQEVTAGRKVFVCLCGSYFSVCVFAVFSDVGILLVCLFRSAKMRLEIFMSHRNS